MCVGSEDTNDTACLFVYTDFPEPFKAAQSEIIQSDMKRRVNFPTWTRAEAGHSLHVPKYGVEETSAGREAD